MSDSNDNSLIRLVMPVHEASEEVLQTLLQEATETTAIIWTDALQGLRALHVYLDEDAFDLQEWENLWTDLVQGVREAGISTIPAEIRVEKVEREDWANSWKDHFHPIEISDALLIQPTWVNDPPKAGQQVVKLDPGLSFGTGNHPTTHYCLEQISRMRPKGKESRSMLDVGCGSGILAIAAARLGYTPVRGFDNDSEAVRIARENAELNQVQEFICWETLDLTAPAPAILETQYDLVCANVIYDVLLDEATTLTRWLKSGSTLVLSGILEEQFTKVSDRFAGLGWRVSDSSLIGEWRSGTFCRVN